MLKRKFRLSLRNKIIIGFALISLLASGATMSGSYMIAQRQNLENFRRRVLNAVTIAALQQNGDEFEQITSASDPLYEKFHLQNTKILNSDHEFVFVYTMRKDEQGIYFVVDAGDPDAEGFSSYGERYLQPGPLLVDSFATLSHPIVEPEIYTDEYGSFISAYAPIRSSDGRQVGVLAMDISADTILDLQKRILLQSLAVMVLASLLGILIGYFAGSILEKPIRDLSIVTKRFASGNLSARSAIATGDEVEDLAYSFNQMADEIQGLVSGLENRVAERTQSVVRANQQSERRASQFEAISQIARAITAMQDIDLLLPRVTELISQQLGFYHAGIFLLDDNREFAVLQAANSPGGKKMLARKHKLKVGQTGIVGYVTGTGLPRIALDTGSDAVFFDNPDLPQTHSELALPLLIGGKVIGALDVQSLEANAFSHEDVQILTTLADQVSVAIQNARNFDETKKLLTQSQSAVGRQFEETWRVIRPTKGGLGYQFSDNVLKPLDKPLAYPHIGEAVKKGEISLANENSSHLAIPIRLRDQVIGVIDLQNPENRPWDQDQIDIANAVAERLSLALESATLLQATRRRADLERVKSDISTSISSSTHFETILRTAVEELSRALGASDVLVQIEPNAMKMDPSQDKNMKEKINQ